MKLPEWIPKEAWDGWVEVRNKMRAPLTERAIKMAISTLEQLREQGYEPGEVLDQSTFRCWRGLFPISGQAPVLRDQGGNKYCITAEGFRKYIQ